MSISKTIEAKLFLQRIISFLAFFLLYPFYWILLFIIGRYRILAIKKIRKQFKSIVKHTSEPLLICSNHLTYIDSVLLVITFSSCCDYILNFRTMPWNFPKTTHMKNNFFYKFISYVGKCIFIDLNAPAEKINQPMKIARHLLLCGEYIMLFPEGHRGMNGLVDTKNFTYGVGKLISEIHNIKILCVYLRGSSQKDRSNFPNKYDQFYCKLNLITSQSITSQAHGLRKIKEISKNIIQILFNMEQEYFAQLNLTSSAVNEKEDK